MDYLIFGVASIATDLIFPLITFPLWSKITVKVGIFHFQ
jgi:hypothetical protein